MAFATSSIDIKTIESSILILGGGEFGLTTALELATKSKFRHHKITLLDRSAVLPAEDAASSDVARVVRSEYSDPFMMKLAIEAIETWQQAPYKDHFNQVGALFLRPDNEQTHKTRALSLATHAPGTLNVLNTTEDGIKSTRMQSAPNPPEDKIAFTYNTAGWAAARPACQMLVKLCIEAGVQFATEELRHLGIEEGRVKGVRAESGAVYLASELVVAALVSWSSTLLPDLPVKATGQDIAKIKLTEQEVALYNDMPIILDSTLSDSYT